MIRQVRWCSSTSGLPGAGLAAVRCLSSTTYTGSERSKGLVVFGISDEDVSVQQKYVQQVPVSYPLLTVKGKMPNLYRDVARYPAIFLIDRSGRLQPAPGPDQSFDKLEAAVDALLSNRS